MAGWVASLSAAEAGNWEICRRDAWFGTPNRRGASVRAGDDLFFWRSREGLFAHAVATDDAEPVTARSHVPWPSPHRYRYVWPMRLVVELAVPLDLRWRDLDALAGIGGVWANRLPRVDDTGCAQVRALMAAAAQRAA